MKVVFAVRSMALSGGTWRSGGGIGGGGIGGQLIRGIGGREVLTDDDDDRTLMGLLVFPYISPPCPTHNVL